VAEKQKTVDELIEDFMKGKGDPDEEYAKMVGSVSIEGMPEEDRGKLFARLRKARRDRMVKELGY
jgi:hypothetical protein